MANKKTLQKVLIVVLLAVACVITILARRQPPVPEARRTVLKCTQCGHTEAVTMSELKKKNRRQNQRWLDQLQETDPKQAKLVRKWLKNPQETQAPPQRPVWGEVAWPIMCVQCEQDAAIFAFKCTQCGAVFFRLDDDGRLRDACPECALPTRNMVPGPPRSTAN